MDSAGHRRKSVLVTGAFRPWERPETPSRRKFVISFNKLSIEDSLA